MSLIELKIMLQFLTQLVVVRNPQNQTLLV